MENPFKYINVSVKNVYTGLFNWEKKQNFIIRMYLQYFVYLQMILCMSQCLGGSTGPAQQPIKKVIKETKP